MLAHQTANNSDQDAMTQKWTYDFSGGKTDGTADMRDLLGGKGANLAEMANMGLPVPPGFTITTDVCRYYYENDKTLPEELTEQVETAIARLESLTESQFGDTKNPLLVSVRSGAAISMPGMMDTVLNLGLNDESVKALAKNSGDERFAWDTYRRFIQMFGDVVLEVPHHDFESCLHDHKFKKGIEADTDLTAEEWKILVDQYKDIVKQKTNAPFPQDAKEQLWMAIGAVFNSWNAKRAITYRRINNISHDLGTTVTVQCMVFGNMGEDCATGVAFTRNPSTGDNHFYGEYLVNAQGEDVVAGIRTPQQLTIAERKVQNAEAPSLEETMPEVFKQLDGIRHTLEQYYRDMQDIEFTVQKGKLYMLQTRTGKRTAHAALKIACDMVEESLIDKKEAICRIDSSSLDQLLHPILDPAANKEVIASGLPASPGVSGGQIVFTADDAQAWKAQGKNVILVRTETSPEDIHGMEAAGGILTSRGGMTSHAAVVARGMGKTCVAGAGSLKIDSENKIMTIGDLEVTEGDILTIDGNTGEVIRGFVPTIDPQQTAEMEKILGWADDMRTMKIRTNAETPRDVKKALEFGAEGIGLCRTEHMFFNTDRILAVRQMIMATDVRDREAALARILPMQRHDFEEIFRLMQEKPVTIRLLDPPLHEFLPHTEKEMIALADATGQTVTEVHANAERLRESNPMLGHRGCRLGISYPEIYDMQFTAILEAAGNVQKAYGYTVHPEIMIPLVATSEELKILKDLAKEVQARIEKREGLQVSYDLGTMIELPRACLTADQIAEHANFFSFGTNDLTQTCFGISRDDAANFLEHYYDRNVLEVDPFVSVDADGVGALIKIASEKAKAVKPNLKLGICGEHGGDPASIRFFQSVGLDYVSCSPYRIYTARLAAAQAAMNSATSKT